MSLLMKRPAPNVSMRDMSKPPAEPPTFAMLQDAGSSFAEHAPPPDPKIRDDENPAKPWPVASSRDFDQFSQEMNRLFEGRESEQNWDKRRKAIIKLSRITRANGPHDYRTQYTSFVKSQLDAILKAVDSLRTNVSTAGLNLLQHVAEALGHGVDFMIDFVAETLITRCCNTSKVKRDPAILTFEVIVSNATCNKNLLHYIVSASEHKDPNARTAVPSWLEALLTRNSRHGDQPGVLDLIEKCIRNGLNDAKPQVRTPMRSTYSTYAKHWPDRAERLKASLDGKTQKLLETTNSSDQPKVPSKRPSIRDLKAAKKKEMDAQEIARPASTHSEKPSIRELKKAKLKELEVAAAAAPPAPLSRSMVKEGRSHKSRNLEAEDVIVRPASAQSTRSSSRDSKNVRKREAEGKEIGRPPSASSHGRVKSRDLDHHESSRPAAGHLHTSSMDRRFHIMSSAPMRPQRSLVEVKRIAPKPSRAVTSTERDASPPPPETHKTSRPAERKLHRSKTETLASYKLDLSKMEASAPKTNKAEPAKGGIAGDLTTASILPLVGGETTAVLPAHESIGAPQVSREEASAKDNVASSRRNPSPVKQDRTPHEKTIEIHEDETLPYQTERFRSRPKTEKEMVTGDSNTKNLAAANGRSKVRSPPRSPPKSPPRSPPRSPTVLREIDQLNQTLEPARKQDLTREKYINKEAAARHRSVSPHSRNPDKARQQLSRAIEKVRAGSMDDHGYRRLQGLIKIHDSLFDDEGKYDELLLALLGTLEAANMTSKRMSLGRQSDHKFQILVTIRLMLAHNAKYCGAYHARALCALIAARRHFESRHHIVGGLEETADDIIRVCSPDQVLHPVLDTLELVQQDNVPEKAEDDSKEGCNNNNNNNNMTSQRSISLGLHILSGLAARIAGASSNNHRRNSGYGTTDIVKGGLETEEQNRLTGFAARCLRHENSETRRATITFCVELRKLIEPEDRYFQLVAGKDEALKSLLTYFITTGRR